MEAVEKPKKSMSVMGFFVPMRMWMDLDELWGEIWGNVYPQFVHPQSTGGVDKILAEKSQHRSPAKAFASLSRKAAGSQGSALSRTPQSAKLSFETRYSVRVSTKLSFEAPPTGGKTLFESRCSARDSIYLSFVSI